MGQKSNSIYNFKCASAVTAMGRKMIKYTEFLIH